ncbi:MAG TPA: hypothetical protein VLH09_11515, partial [Bryobacteraceae bacterium]|nr:hypothetical protein [Bryobacteraceae bacterium]
ATATDQDSFNRAVVSAFEEGLIPENQMTAWMQKTWNPQTQAEVGQLAAQSASGRQILEAAMKRADEGRKVEDQARENQQFMETTYQTNRTARRMENPPAPQATPVIRTTELGTFLIDPQVPAAKEIRTEDNKPIRSSEAGGEGGAARERFDWSRSQAAKSELNAGRKEHDELQTHEQEQHQLKLRIGEATKALGKAIKDKKDTYTGSDGKQYPATEQQMNSLKLELEGADRKIADLQRRQRNIREQLGVGEFTSQQAPSGTIPLSQMMSGDAARAPSPQPPAPAPAKPAPAKTFPRARLAAFAAANGITEQAAEAELKKQGYALN